MRDKILIDSSSPQERRGFIKKLAGFVAASAAMGGFTNLFAKKTYSGTELGAYASPDAYIGSITMFGGNFAIRQWALCAGQLLAISSNEALFSILGCTFGGDCRATFALPDLRGRTPIGVGAGPGLSDRRLGQIVGTQTNILTVSNLPPHNHTANYTPPTYGAALQSYKGRGGLTADPAGAVLGQPTTSGVEIYSSNTANTNMGSSGVTISPTSQGQVTTNLTGGGQSFNNMQPSLAVNFLICLYGLYPPRN